MRSLTLVSCGLLLAAAIGCSNGESTAQAVAAAPAPAAAAKVGAPPPSGDAVPPVKAAPLATSEASISGIRVDVTELKRGSGGTLTLKFTIVNESGRRLGHTDVGIGFGGLMEAPYTIGGVHLIDAVGKRKYFVAKDSSGACVCSTFGFVEAGARANHWAKFSAPPEDVERISVVIPPFAPLDDVPVSR
jgi:hypothetical protein